MNFFARFPHAYALLLTAASCIAVTPVAFAATGSMPSAPTSDDSVPQTRLNVAGTDFTSPGAVAHLKVRLRHAAIAICAPYWDGRRLLAMDERRCYETALNDGMAQVDSKQQQAMRKTTVNMAAAQPQERTPH